MKYSPINLAMEVVHLSLSNKCNCGMSVAYKEQIIVIYCDTPQRLCLPSDSVNWKFGKNRLYNLKTGQMIFIENMNRYGEKIDPDKYFDSGDD